MVVLHIASIDNNPYDGVCVAVPQHVVTQNRYAEIGFINIRNIDISLIKESGVIQFHYNKSFDNASLPKPFNHPDLVVFHECYRFDYLKISRNLEKKAIPYIIIPHGELRKEAQKKKHFKKVVANFLLFNRFIKHALAIQCLSSPEKGSTLFKNNKFIGTNGISIPNKQKKSFNQDGLVFIYIGRYEWRVKGLDLLFDAIKGQASFLRDHHCRFELYGPDVFGRFAEVKELIEERKIEDIVALNHEIEGKEKENQLLKADIFIQTSRHEGMPMGVLEAMSYGLPCIVSEGTTLGGLVEANNAGWNTGTTVSDISNSIMKSILNKTSLGEKSRNAVQFVKDNYSWDLVSKQTIEEYGKIISK